VVDNVSIQSGIAIGTIRWALTTTQTGCWHPVTWLSHMLDFECLGLALMSKPMVVTLPRVLLLVGFQPPGGF
jgi:hypothetical protein